MKKATLENLCLLGLTIVALVLVITLFSGCTTTTRSTIAADGSTNIVKASALDPAKLSQVEAALEPVVAGATRRVLKNSPQHADEIALYLRSLGAVFCDMQTSGRFAPEYLIDAADKIVAPRLPDDYEIDIKNAAIAIYKIAWGDRFTAELPPDAWAAQVCKLLCASIDTGLKDSRKPGVL